MEWCFQNVLDGRLHQVPSFLPLGHGDGRLDLCSDGTGECNPSIDHHSSMQCKTRQCKAMHRTVSTDLRGGGVGVARVRLGRGKLGLGDAPRLGPVPHHVVDLRRAAAEAFPRVRIPQDALLLPPGEIPTDAVCGGGDFGIRGERRGRDWGKRLGRSGLPIQSFGRGGRTAAEGLGAAVAADEVAAVAAQPAVDLLAFLCPGSKT